MKTEVLVDQLKSLDCAKCPRRIECCSADGDVCFLFGEAADRLLVQQGRIEQLEEELKEEMYRHDRVQDFEVAEAQELARVKGQLDEAIRELQYLSVCSTCSKNGTVCHVGMPVAEEVVCCGGYRWRGSMRQSGPSVSAGETSFT